MKTKTFAAMAALAIAAMIATPALAGPPKPGGGHGGGHHGGGQPPGVHNSNRNYNDNRNYVDSSNRNYNTNNNHVRAQGGAGGAGGAGGSANQNQSQAQNQSQSQSANNQSDNSNSNNSTVSVDTNYQRAPVNTAYAASLYATEDTCMGSSSAGAQGITFGLSFGTTWRDQNCQRLKNSRQLVALGYHRAATALMCQDDNVRDAMAQAGTPCPTGAEPIAAVAPIAPPPVTELAPPEPVAEAPPIVTPPRRRPRPPVNQEK